jgi:hypothetical protein
VIDLQSEPRRNDGGAKRFEGSEPLSRDIAEKKQREMDIVSRHGTAAAFVLRLPRDLAQRSLDVRRWPRGEENACAVRTR